MLVVEIDGLEADCSVVWRKAPELAVKLVSPPCKAPRKRAQVVTALASGQKPSLRRKPNPA